MEGIDGGLRSYYGDAFKFVMLLELILFVAVIIFIGYYQWKHRKDPKNEHE